jgi:hypothetical protein
LLAVAVLLVAAACGPKGGHTTDSWGPYNLLVHNSSSASLEVWVDNTEMGTIDSGRTGYYWINPGIKDVDLISDAQDANGNTPSELFPNTWIPSTGFVEEDFSIN